MDMDIAALSSSMIMSETLNAVGTRVLDMTMESMEQQSEGLQKALEMSVNPHIGGNIDVSV